MTREQKRHQT